MVTVIEKPTEEIDKRLRDSPINRWWHVVQGSLVAGAWLYLYASVLPPLVADWLEDADYSHGFLVPLLSAYFIWERRWILSRIKWQSSWLGIVFLLIGLCLFFIGNIGAELFLMRFSMIVVITGIVWYLFGFVYMRTLLFPIMFLLFMIPLPAIILNTITFPLQLLAAKLSTSSLQMIGLPVYREGNIIFLPHTTLEIVEACSGIRSLVSLAALTVVFAYVTQSHVYKRGILMVSAVPIALAANAFRIWGTGVLAYLYGTKAAEGFYHVFAGWLVFVVAFILLLVEGLILSLIWPTHSKSERTT
jgi:exosortase A